MAFSRTGLSSTSQPTQAGPGRASGRPAATDAPGALSSSRITWCANAQQRQMHLRRAGIASQHLLPALLGCWMIMSIIPRPGNV